MHPDYELELLSLSIMQRESVEKNHPNYLKKDVKKKLTTSDTITFM